jgi:predicted dinucleotide-utilizing enzyme
MKTNHIISGTASTITGIHSIIVIRDENGNVYAAIANEALYDNNKAQVESLLSIHQALADPQNGIDDRARCEHDIDGKPG